MSLTITGEAEMNFPKPQHEVVAETVRALFDGEHAVRASAVAHAMNRHNTESLLFHLRKAERLGLIARGLGESWFPV
jgi:hypothetical protein